MLVPSLVPSWSLLALPLAVLSAAVVVPFSGILVRYRANYSPKSVQLDGEERATGPVVNGYFTMFRRVYKLEGVAGLYKGFMPTIFTGFVFFILSFLTFLVTPVHSPAFILILTLLSFIVDLPLSVITNRAICTPYRLPSWEPKTALRVLLTPTERRSPWKLYLNPGLFFVHVLSLLWAGVIVGFATAAVAWKIVEEGRNNHNEVLKWVFVGVYAAVVVVAALVTCPLQVLFVRLTLQRNHGTSGSGDGNAAEVSEPRTEVEQAARLELKEYSKDVDVIGLRDEFDPYTSLFNCFVRMKREEGVKVFYRAYWVILLSAVSGPGMSGPSL
ncbi:hypothetical protein D9758_016340 [Tetrapyrgos nigripes]|uniref:Uncharacterized protein n=1 Tax=Tetrapyrgos nigripes TaxID=182062 RepID=A0A8H5FCK0_9AGAR|nr:hypothetical protein D9758_016340 [Tetrapyrgos nigripes]